MSNVLLELFNRGKPKLIFFALLTLNNLFF